MNDYKVYKHIFPNGKIYIGITRQSLKKRWGNGYGYIKSPLMYNAINKYGWENIKHELICSNISKENAELLEITLIFKNKSNQRTYGYNILQGGNCSNGITEDGKKRIRAYQLGKKRSEETKRKMSISALNKHYKRPMTEERKERLRLANYKKVFMFDKESNFIKQFNSIKEAEIKLNINNSNISQCCMNKRKTAGGYIWKYVKKGCDDLLMMQK